MQALKLMLIQHDKPPSRKQFDSCAHWIVIRQYTLEGGDEAKLPYAAELAARRKRMKRTRADTEPMSLDLPNARASRVACVFLEPGLDAFVLLTIARKLVAVHTREWDKELGVVVHGFSAAETERIGEALIAAIWAAAAQMPVFKREPRDSGVLARVRLYGMKCRHGFKRTLAEAEGNAIARYLSMLPSNKLTPTLYLRQVRSLARDYGWKLEFMDIKALQQKQAGAFLAVAQGSPAADAGIVRLLYSPATARPRGRLALVGKGICYDTGGTNLKPAKSMFGMHEDMQGSAVALGTLLALTRMRVNYTVECYLALAMNHIGPGAYKPNDVVTAADGTTIEVVHTDAEGRMVLADTLAIAAKRKPGLIIDYATLTGTCVYALGTAYSGVFTNRQEFHQTLIDAGRDSGERVWPFPLDEDYDKALESTIADIKQCALESGPDHILAARFLQRFVRQEIPWIHIDLAAGNQKGGLAHVPTDTTGFGIRYTLNLLLDKKILK
jgi:leucyl aminopeptidase